MQLKILLKIFLKIVSKNVLKLPSKEPLDIAAGRALKEFLQLVQQELEDAEFDEQQVKALVL